MKTGASKIVIREMEFDDLPGTFHLGEKLFTAEKWILDRSTFARIRDKTGVSKMGKWKQVQEYANHIPFPIQNYLRNKEKASGILLPDATFTKVKGEDRAIMIAYDTGIGVVDY